MNAGLKYAIATLTALIVSGPASAQAVSTSLPLTTVGDRLLWSVGDQDLTLDVAVGGQVRLDLYSPRLDPADYRAATSYGDEGYGGAGEEVVTTFVLRRADGQELLRRAFPPGPHAWETLLNQELPAGQYRLEAVTQGNGKNTFALRLSGVSAAVSTARPTVNVRSRDWVPALTVTSAGPGDTLRLYDGDGPGEMEARLRDGQGRVTPLPVSAALAWADLPLPGAGTYTVELRQPEAARQYSNAVSFALTRQGVPEPITISRVDQTGLLRVAAELVLPGGVSPTRVDLTIGGTGLQVDGRAEARLPAGEYPVKAAQVAGAQVSVDRPSVRVPLGGSGDVLVQVRPQVALALTSDKTEVCEGDTVTLTARASTGYAGDLPLDLGVDAPELKLDGEGRLQGTLSAARPGELRVTGTVTRPGPLAVTARLAPWGQTQALSLVVRPDATTLQLARLPLADARVGDEVEVRLRVTNTGSQPTPYTLLDTLGAGLTALSSPSFTGTLAGGETRELSYRARVDAPGTADLEARLETPGCPRPQTARGNLQAAAPVPTVQTLPVPEQPARASTVLLPFDAPVQARELVIAHAVPVAATYVPGSGRLDDRPLPDPLRGPSGTLYWVLPGQTRGVLTYDLAHTSPLGELARPSLLVRLAGDRSETLMGRIDEADLKAAQPLAAETAEENPGPIKLPLAGSVIRLRDRINVVIEVPQGERPALTVNGTPVGEDRLGTEVQDSVRGVQRLTYVGVPLKPGPNVLRAGAEEVRVTLAGGTARVEVTPEALVADGSTPLRLKIRTLDAFGTPSGQSSLTVRSSLEPRTPDVVPGEAGYQVRLENGEGVLELQPQSAPGALRLDVLQGDEVQTWRYEVTPDRGRVGVGILSATLGLDGHLDAGDLSWRARGYVETPVGEGKLYAAADRDGLPGTDNPNVRAPVYGDASTEETPLQGIDPVAAVYDHPAFRAAYRSAPLPVSVLPVGEQLTALTVTTKGTPAVSAFVAAVPGDRVSGVEVTPSGTRILRLPDGGLVDSSETLEVVTRERGTGKELGRRILVRNVDYTVDYPTGIVTLVRALDRVDENFNDVRVLASYRLVGKTAGRSLAYGAQIQQQGETYSVGAAVVNLDGRTTFGVRGTFDDGTTRADTRLASSGGLQASADLQTRVGNGPASFRVRYQDASYAGLAPFAVGLSVGGSYSARLGGNLNATLDGEYHRTPTSTGGSVTARADSRFGPFSVGGGLKSAFGDTAGLGAVLGAGYHQKPLDVDVAHTQPLSGNLDPVTTFNVRYRLNDQVTLGLKDEVTWGKSQTAVLSLDTTLGRTNYAVGYELPTASGAGNRARFGVSTSLPLNDRTTLGLRGSALYDVGAGQAELAGGADLNYKAETFSVAGGVDLTLKGGQANAVLRGGITGSVTSNLTLTADGLVAFGMGGNGQRLALGYAYRNRTLNSLGYARLVRGTLAGNNPELSTGLSAEYRQPTWAVRGGVDTRTLLNDSGSFTAQASLGGTAYLTDRFGVGAWGRLLTQPSTDTTLLGYGLEASARALPGTWLTAGYNFKGFEGLPSAGTYTKQGAYLRLDLTLDETVGGRK